LKKQQDRYSKGTPPQPDYKGLGFDRDHEGHFGWNIDEIIKGRDFDNGSGSGKLEGWVEGYEADIALVHLGTNDAFNRHPKETSVEEIREVVRILREDNPNITILLAKLIPASRKPGDSGAVESLNELIPGLAEDMHTEDSPVVLVDQFESFDVEAHTYDGVHPNEAGEEKMARVWFEAIKEVVESN
jgi:lysophospholipase L1-like esterase